MVVIEVHTPLLGAVAAASAHGLTDLRRPGSELTPYALPLTHVFAPFPTEVVTPLFICCSIQHFSRDVGYGGSALLHATFIGLAGCGMAELGWTIFAAFYCCLHVPSHIRAHGATLHPRFAAAIIVAAGLFALVAQASGEVFRVTDLMQLGVVAHILVDETTEHAAATADADSPGATAGLDDHELALQRARESPLALAPWLYGERALQ